MTVVGSVVGSVIGSVIGKIGADLGSGGGGSSYTNELCIGTDGLGDYGFSAGSYGSLDPATTKAGTVIHDVRVGSDNVCHLGDTQEPDVDYFFITIEGYSAQIAMTWDSANSEYVSDPMPGLHDAMVAASGKCVGMSFVRQKDFWAAWPKANEMALLLSGYEPATTVHANEMYALDHEGLGQAFAVDEPVWQGARVVENLTTFSEDNTSLTTHYIVGTTITKDAVEFTQPTSYFYCVHNFPGESLIGRTFIFSIVLSSLDKTTIALRIAPSSEHYLINITPTPTRYCIKSTITTAIDFTAYGIDNQAMYDGDGLSGTIFASKWQLEEVTGQVNPVAASEYIKTEGVPVRIISSVSNENTIGANQVLIENPGIPLDPVPMLVARNQSENFIALSHLLTDVISDTDTLDIECDFVCRDTTVNGVLVGCQGTTTRAYIGVNSSRIGGGYGNESYAVISDPAEALITGQPHKGRIIADSTSVSLLLDGVEVYSGPTDGTCVNNLEFAIGCVNSNGGMVAFFDGTILGVKINGVQISLDDALGTSSVNTIPASNHSNSRGPYYLEFEHTGDDVDILSIGSEAFLKIEN